MNPCFVMVVNLYLLLFLFSVYYLAGLCCDSFPLRLIGIAAESTLHLLIKLVCHFKLIFNLICDHVMHVLIV